MINLNQTEPSQADLIRSSSIERSKQRVACTNKSDMRIEEMQWSEQRRHI